MSVNTALIRLIYPQRFLGRGMGINSFVVAVSSAAGPTIAAAILSMASWQWLFLINVPLGIISLLLAMRYLPANTGRSKVTRFDLPSAIMNALTFGLLITALGGFAQGQSGALVAAEVMAMLVVGFFFVRRQLKMPVPLLPVDLLRIPLFSLSICTSICSFCAQMLAMVSLPFFLQSMMGRSEVETGLLLTPWPLATMVMAPLAGYLIEKVHAGLLGAMGLIIMACGLFGWLYCPPRRRTGYYLANGALRRGLWSVPVPQQSHHRLVSAGSSQRRRKRHAGDRAPAWTEHWRRAGGAAV